MAEISLKMSNSQPSTNPKSSGPQPVLKPKTKPKDKRTCLTRLQVCGTLTIQIISYAVLMAMILWLFIRMPEPEVHVTDFVVDDLIDPKNLSTSTLIHYNFTLHNPDLWKSFYYEALVMRIYYSEGQSANGVTVDFNEDGKGYHQRPRDTTVLRNHDVSFPLSPGVTSKKLTENNTIHLELIFVLDVSFKAFNQVMSTRQRTRTGQIHFNGTGIAHLKPGRGLLLK